MNPKGVLAAALEIALDPAAISALAFWPRFSLTSYRMVSSLAKQNIVPRTVIDVGANAGQFAIASAKLFPDVAVHSFEPNPDCAATLQRNVASLKNVQVYPLALGDEKGEAAFHVNSHSHSSSILPLTGNHREAFPQAREVDTIRVTLSTLDQVFADVELPGPVLLKLDVQGYEARVLRGAANTLKRIDHVVLEASFKPMYQGEMLFMDMALLMRDYGFTFLRPVGLLPDPRTGEIIQMDALFRRNMDGE